MKAHCRRVARYTSILVLILSFVFTSSIAWTQTPAVPPKPCPECLPARPSPGSVQTFYLTNIAQQADANEILTAIRNLLTPTIKIALVPGANAIVLEAPTEQLALAQKLISDLDRPRKIYRLTYNITEREGGKRADGQHYSLIAVSGQRATLKQGGKVPVVTGTYKAESGPETQVTYLDTGMIFDATVIESGNGAILRSKVEQLSVTDEKSGVGPQDPILRHTALESVSALTLGKPAVLDSLEIPGTTRRLEIEALLELAQ